MDKDKRIAELEDIIEQRDARIRELTEDRDASQASISREIEATHEWSDLLDSAREAYASNDEFWAQNDSLRLWYDDLVKQWNKFVPQYNAAVASKLRNFGRPLAASPAQQADVLKRRKSGQSLRSIADETGLGLQTIRTIIDKANGVDRATLARLKRIKLDKHAEAHERVNRGIRKGFPKRIDAAIKEAKGLNKELKGLGVQLA